ncbi:ferredoxin--NADP reductase [Pontibacter sp. G13]|uniref:ferredoxin--NADP reductase n=1 Tax=Pontibacter sp. G13 TaxID=3074898 RepID=UPI00288A8678|nr:ferredoxin--NADP reductase [Pontibacter sp. G13]WNJ16486.1 ferredoxin--NADP reductase [Pontibacter sp. G13]
MSIHFAPLVIDEIKDETPDAYTVYFRQPESGPFHYEPGQYLTFRMSIDGAEIRRSYSLSSSPTQDDRLSVTIKRVEDGRASNFIRDHLKAGDVLESYPPMGHFKVTVDPSHSKHYILIGAGSGITPLYSILRTVLAHEPESKVTLWYGSRNEDSIIFADELVELGQTYGERLHVLHSLSQPTAEWKGYKGRLDADRIYDLVSDLFMKDEHRKEYFVCGPNGLMEAAEKALEKHAVNPNDIYHEYYSAPTPSEADVAKQYAGTEGEEDEPELNGHVVSDGEQEYEIVKRTVKVIIDNQPHELEVNPEQYVLDSAIAANLDPPYACQTGICTTCRAMLNEGVVSMDETEGLSREEIEAGFVLTCQCHPLTENVELEFK